MNLTDARRMTLELMEYHGVRGYTFSYMRRRTKFGRAGQCNWRKRTLQLAPVFVELNHPFVVKQTVLHEIAHALKPKHNHNKFWKRQARDIGYVGKRCWNSKVVKTH